MITKIALSAVAGLAAMTVVSTSAVTDAEARRGGGHGHGFRHHGHHHGHHHHHRHHRHHHHRFHYHGGYSCWALRHGYRVWICG